MTRTVLLVVTIVWAVLLGGGYAVALAVPAFTATRLHTDRVGFDADEYTWNGEPIVLERAGNNTNGIACDVSPKNGENRTLRVQGSTKRYPSEFESWFSGSAKMVCHGSSDVMVHSGLGKQVYQLGKNRAVMIGAVVLAFGPLLAVYAFVPGRRR